MGYLIGLLSSRVLKRGISRIALAVLDFFSRSFTTALTVLFNMAVREQLYNLVEPFDTGFLNVTDIHTLHYEQAGNPVSHIIPFLAHAQMPTNKL